MQQNGCSVWIESGIELSFFNFGDLQNRYKAISYEKGSGISACSTVEFGV